MLNLQPFQNDLSLVTKCHNPRDCVHMKYISEAGPQADNPPSPSLSWSGRSLVHGVQQFPQLHQDGGGSGGGPRVVSVRHNPAPLRPQEGESLYAVGDIQ